MTRLAIRNGLIIDPAASAGERRADLFIADGKIVAIGAAPAGFSADRIVDATGLWVIPGLVDLAARLREPGFEYKATLESELRAAVAGGVTSLVCPPDTDPPLDEPGLITMLEHKVSQARRGRVYPLGALTVGLKGAVLTEMAELSEAGCIGFSQALAPLVDTQVLASAMRYARGFDLTIHLHPVEAYLARGGVAHDGAVASRLGLPGIPVTAETIAMLRIFELQRAVGARVHLCRISSSAGVELLRAAKREGLPVSADVAVHHLHLTDVDIGYFDSRHRLEPPLRSQRDRAALRAALADGTIDAVCSDHTPVDDDAKQLPFGEAEPGATGLELLLPLLLKWAREDRVPMPVAIGRASRDAARVIGIDAGTLAPGAGADLSLVAADQAWLCDPQALLSQGSHTPFSGIELVGRAQLTIAGGELVFERGR